ncbi:ferritin-like fold-containing protein [Leucobacter sp. UCMA 4100]|uniref:ferritin-like fold-containing protein n=1 Tax=Leucobacter sp. UCMA 4100 TaxID=2810534 RepID=UPI0022EA2063|nr:ferritin-like fold-containing protein [Leucobacter sp. UCMA 4100]
MDWFKRFRKQAGPARKLKTRSAAVGTLHVELAEFAPAVVPFLGLVSYLKLELYTQSSRAVVAAPSLEAKSVLAEVAAEALSKQQRFTEQLRKRGEDPHEAMEPFAGLIDRYLERIAADDWHEHVLSVYLVSGLFDGFFASLAGGIKDGFTAEAIEILADNTGRDRLRELLAEQIEEIPGLSDRLALWGRRLVGDTLLVARGVLALSEHRTFNANEMEPVFTELIADHIRRMDGLGLTA